MDGNIGPGWVSANPHSERDSTPAWGNYLAGFYRTDLLQGARQGDCVLLAIFLHHVGTPTAIRGAH
jgi:hypothetical protein